MVFRAFAWSHRIPLPGPLARENEKRDVSRCERGTLELSDSTILLLFTNSLLTVYTHKIYT